MLGDVDGAHPGRGVVPQGLQKYRESRVDVLEPGVKDRDQSGPDRESLHLREVLALADEIVISAFRLDATVFHQDQPVAIAHRAEPMRNDYDREAGRGAKKLV